MQPLVSLDESLHTHLKQGTIGQLSEALVVHCQTTATEKSRLNVRRPYCPGTLGLVSIPIGKHKVPTLVPDD